MPLVMPSSSPAVRPGLRVVFVHHRSGSSRRFPGLHHALEAMLDDHAADFVAESQVVRDAVGVGRPQDVGWAIFVLLQAFAVQA